MKRLAGLIAGFGLALVGWLLLVLGQEGRPTPDGEWVRQAYAVKNQRADGITEPKMVIVAGSNAMFGVHSALLSQQYQRPVVNQAVNAGLGLPYIIEQGKRVLKAGDIALLPLEYPLFNYNFDTNHVMLDYYYAQPGLFDQQPWPLQMALLRDITLERVIRGYKGMPEGFQVGGLYGPQHLNGDGDQTHSALSARSDWQLQHLKAQQASRYGADFSARNESWRLLGRFQQWAEQRNICLIYIPSTLMHHPLYHDDPVEARLYRELPAMAARFGLRYVGDPYDFMYAPEHYFDTNYHLVAESRLTHTRKLIDVLGPELDSHCRPTP